MQETASQPLHDTLSEATSRNRWPLRLVLGLVLAGLYLISRNNYLLFHSLVEIFSIVVAGSLFMIAWTSRHYSNNPYLLFIGIAYLFVGTVDLLHTLSYKGMNIFQDYDYYANQLWIGARYLESLSLLLAFLLCSRSRPFRPMAIFTSYCIITALLIGSIFIWKVFPECFQEGVGLTAFKKNSEYMICAILLLDIGLLFKVREQFTDTIFRFLLWSLLFTIVSELAFTFYMDNYGFSNLVGHYFKLFSFWLIYRAIIATSIEQPYQMIFHDLNQANQQLRQTAEDLQSALNEVKTLSGILPICACCKKIRDDQGYWSRVESYISKHSDAQFSHGYCPECYQKVLREVDEYTKAKQGTTGA